MYFVVGYGMQWRKVQQEGVTVKLFRRGKMKKSKVLEGFAVVVLDRGFVYVGDVVHDGEWCVISNAKNIRVWGTTKGLGELTLGGPTVNTLLDSVGVVRCPARAVISIIDTEKSKWNCK